MATVTAIGHPVFDGVIRGDEIEGVIARFSLHGVFPGLGHVALDAATADAERCVVCVLVQSLVVRSDILAWPVTG